MTRRDENTAYLEGRGPPQPEWDHRGPPLPALRWTNECLIPPVNAGQALGVVFLAIIIIIVPLAIFIATIEVGRSLGLVELYHDAWTGCAAPAWSSEATLCDDKHRVHVGGSAGGDYPRSIGIVKFYVEQRGYGFIRPSDGSPDVLVHVSALNRSGLPSIESGQLVEYELVSSAVIGKGVAENIKMLTSR